MEGEARSKCGFELEDPGTVSVHLQNCHDQSWGARELQGECFPGESFSTVGRAEGPRDGVEGLGLCSCKEWRERTGHFEGKMVRLATDLIGCLKVRPLIEVKESED